MAVEATNLNLFPPQLVQHRDLVQPSNHDRNVISAYNCDPMRFPAIPLFHGNQSFYQPAVCDNLQTKTSINTESGLTCNNPAPRKRTRDSINEQLYAAQYFPAVQKNNNSAVDEYVSSQFQQYQLEVFATISQHTKKMRIELEARQRIQAKLLVSAIGEGVMKKLNEKDEQIQRICKLNLALQERMRNVYVENQLWKDLAQANEATVNTLRKNLEQVIAHVSGGEERIAGGCGGGSAVEEDAQSSCGSCDSGNDLDGVKETDNDGSGSNRTCRRCGERESCVLLLPCRHLCLCDVCGSGTVKIEACPVCNSSMKATLHVNMSR